LLGIGVERWTSVSEPGESVTISSQNFVAMMALALASLDKTWIDVLQEMWSLVEKMILRPMGVYEAEVSEGCGSLLDRCQHILFCG
jgi:hypothetical protein